MCLRKETQTSAVCVAVLVDVIEFQTAEAYSSLYLNNVKYNMYVHSGEVRVNVMPLNTHITIIHYERL
jgi:hypothetical protein